MAAIVPRVLRLQICTLTRPAGAFLVPNVGCQGQQHSRGYPTSKHYDMKWRLLRKKKVFKIDLPKFVELKSEKPKEKKTTDELRMEMKKEGRLPPRIFQYLPLNISSTLTIIDPFKPQEGDGKQSFLSTAKLSDTVSRMIKGTKSMKHLRKLKKYEDFVESDFAVEAQKIVTEAQSLLGDIYKNQDRLHELVTEKAFPEMVHGLENKTMHWQLVETVEPARVVQVRTETMITSDNLFCQVTVRLHTKQILAIYDRFGRLMYGDPLLPKSAVEYVVMEKWISDTNGRWRIHGKIVPEWMSPRDSLIKTYKVPVFDPLPPADSPEDKKTEKKVDEEEDTDDDGGDDNKRKGSPQVALA
ncbi:unnamed protein product [Candidula unifasciata]|uniref:Large ribosomal subunit protein mL45 n=1 Tax=Candidula unifasciata TaxID=100452 RepID=A0A8S4A1X2_9EUPU|nr:unnamed protein product [Candidula unifasciata]